MMKQGLIIGYLILSMCCAVLTQKKVLSYKPPRINKNVVVIKDPVTTELDLSPIIDHYTPDGSPLKVNFLT